MQPPRPSESFVAPPSMPGPRKLRARMVAIVVVVVAVVSYYALVIYPQPNIALTDVHYGTAGCYPTGGLYWIYGMRYTLVNTGSADGSATITGYLDGTTLGSVLAFVPRGASVDSGFTISAPDCGAHTPSVAITSVAKA